MSPEGTAGPGTPASVSPRQHQHRRRRSHRRSWWKRVVRDRFPARTVIFYCFALAASVVVAYGVTRCDIGTEQNE